MSAPRISPSARGWFRITPIGSCVLACLMLTACGGKQQQTSQPPPPPPQGTLTITPSQLSFGTVGVGASATLTLDVANSGSAAVSISNVQLTGNGFSWAAGAPTLPLAIAADKSVSWSVAFAPQASGAQSGSLSIASNASDSSLNIGLAGSGAAHHAVALTWAPSASSVNGYNVYRGDGQAGTFARITTAPIANTNFSDSTVLAGQTYHYAVTAVDAQGAESSFSNQVTVTIPNL